MKKGIQIPIGIVVGLLISVALGVILFVLLRHTAHWFVIAVAPSAMFIFFIFLSQRVDGWSFGKKGRIRWSRSGIMKEEKHNASRK